MTNLTVDGNVSQGATNGSPYVIDNANVQTTFDTITLQNGGYIKIAVPCTLQSGIFNKVTGGSAKNLYDIEIAGKDGKQGEAGDPGAAQSQAQDGKNAACDGGGGACKNYGHDGQDGKKGNPGDAALEKQDITKGADAPPVTLSLGTLNASISVLNRGGNGGKGGNGGAGGTGQQGGDGGSGKTCGGAKCPSGDGGKGGNGGDGGKGGNGGDGGKGSTVTITYTGTGNVISDAVQSTGGNAGNGGVRGEGGAGGSGGGDNGAGDPGLKGADGDDAGVDGNFGKFVINGVEV